ncbi:MAG: 50S ribosomal protein L9, partial [Thermodesulfobacteriota bacterium]
KVGGDEKIFGSVTSQEISRYISEKGFNISKKDIILDNPIKSLGEFDVKIKLHREVNAVIKVSVVNEDQ